MWKIKRFTHPLSWSYLVWKPPTLVLVVSAKIIVVKQIHLTVPPRMLSHQLVLVTLLKSHRESFGFMPPARQFGQVATSAFQICDYGCTLYLFIVKNEYVRQTLATYSRSSLSPSVDSMLILLSLLIILHSSPIKPMNSLLQRIHFINLEDTADWIFQDNLQGL